MLDIFFLGKHSGVSGNVSLLLLVLFSTALSQQYFLSARDPKSPVQQNETSLFLGFYNWMNSLSASGSSLKLTLKR